MPTLAHEIRLRSTAEPAVRLKQGAGVLACWNQLYPARHHAVVKAPNPPWHVIQYRALPQRHGMHGDVRPASMASMRAAGRRRFSGQNGQLGLKKRAWASQDPASRQAVLRARAGAPV